MPRQFIGDVVAAAVPAALLSGIPSTLYAWWSGGDLLEATRAAGAMLLRASASDAALVAAAMVVHAFITVFWIAAMRWLLPPRHVLAGAIAASLAIAFLDLKLIAPLFFPEVAALAFGPQLADHLAFGAIAGYVLRLRYRRRERQAARS